MRLQSLMVEGFWATGSLVHKTTVSLWNRSCSISGFPDSGLDLKHYTLVAAATGGGGAVDIAVRIKEESGQGKCAITPSAETVQGDFAPLTAGDRAEFESHAIAADESATYGGAVEIAAAVDDQSSSRKGSVAIHVGEAVHGALGPCAAGSWHEFENLANIIGSTVVRYAVKVAGGVEDDSTERLFTTGSPTHLLQNRFRPLSADSSWTQFANPAWSGSCAYIANC